MTGWFSILLGGLFLGLVWILFMREMSLYRKDQRSRADLIRYSRRRLWLRFGISACLCGEVFLIFIFPFFLRWVGPQALKGSESGWFIVYVSMVLLLALGLMLLAFLDLKESSIQLEKSEKQLLSELIHEVQRGNNPPEVH